MKSKKELIDKIKNNPEKRAAALALWNSVKSQPLRELSDKEKDSIDKKIEEISEKYPYVPMTDEEINQKIDEFEKETGRKISR
ncbi:MAG: hypothetical protein SLAVMIC_00212 [uncultured marine phage]|uniref:Uncharacterized protein n=1 Tax=uncultured marine phage TaxID=707152 RepID=A0A8D9CBV3_9VIRU|nr:MAG: hypothetical protein SLAVMIC_00212 [uncultured marine phage]